MPQDVDEAERIVRQVYDEYLWRYWQRYFPDGDEPGTLMLPDKTCIPRESGDWRRLFMALDAWPPYQQIREIGIFVSPSRAVEAARSAAFEWGFALRTCLILPRLEQIIRKYGAVRLWLTRTSTQYPYCDTELIDTQPVGGHGARRRGHRTVGWGITVLAKGVRK